MTYKNGLSFGEFVKRAVILFLDVLSDMFTIEGSGVGPGEFPHKWRKGVGDFRDQGKKDLPVTKLLMADVEKGNRIEVDKEYMKKFDGERICDDEKIKSFVCDFPLRFVIRYNNETGEINSEKICRNVKARVWSLQVKKSKWIILPKGYAVLFQELLN